MPAGQQIPQDAASPANGRSMAHDLFALTDEQILEIEPELQDVQAARDHAPLTGKESPHGAPASLPASSAATPQDANRRLEAGATRAQQGETVTAQPGMAVPSEPPPWLAAQMKDPWCGEEAKELWNAVQQAKSEAAAYRAAFATPEDARAFKELYPGGVNEGRAAAERARVLDDIDRSYFGVAGKSAQEVSASRAQLAQRMLREDPAAFREMVFAGLRALEDAGKQPGAASVGATLGSPGVNGDASANEAHVAAYAAFEKAANEDLERSVGSVIARTLEQALPNAARVSNGSGVGAQHAAPLQARLSQAIRHDVEAALKGDRQLGEQVAQILSGRRLDNETRGQVVRLIGERAQQLVPIAAKRVLNDWTQTTLAAHRSHNARADAASARREVAPASPESRGASAQAGSSAGASRDRSQDLSRTAARSDTRRVDYRKLSDEQILEM
jgi:ubiquinone biosynthesis protein UbiJ